MKSSTDFSLNTIKLLSLIFSKDSPQGLYPKLLLLLASHHLLLLLQFPIILSGFRVHIFWGLLPRVQGHASWGLQALFWCLVVQDLRYGWGPRLIPPSRYHFSEAAYPQISRFSAQPVIHISLESHLHGWNCGPLWDSHSHRQTGKCILILPTHVTKRLLGVEHLQPKKNGSGFALASQVKPTCSQDSTATYLGLDQRPSSLRETLS